MAGEFIGRSGKLIMGGVRYGVKIFGVGHNQHIEHEPTMELQRSVINSHDTSTVDLRKASLTAVGHPVGGYQKILMTENGTGKTAEFFQKVD